MIKNKLSELIGRKRLNMAEVARLSGLSHITLFNLYHDKNKAVQLETLNKLCWALDCKIEDIYEYIDEKKN